MNQNRPSVYPIHASEFSQHYHSTFGIQQGSSQYRRLVASFQRIFGATIFFGTDTQKDRAAVVHCAQFNFMTEARIWDSRDLEQTLLASDCQNVIVLSEEFYREISSHSIPTDLEGGEGSFSEPGSTGYARPRKFREKLEDWLKLVRAMWPECPAHIDQDGIALVVDRSMAVLPTI